MTADLPPLADEDHVCPTCAMVYADVTVDAAVAAIRSLPEEYRAAVAAVPREMRGRRPEPGTWSVAEYVCHVRDVYLTYTIRLHRARTEDRPQVEPMLGDLRARRFRYAEADVDAVLDELARTAEGFCAEVAQVGPADWDRTVTRLPGEARTARWLVRQALHEGRHHLDDVRRVGRQPQ